jgi:hypothetical protein
VACRAGVVIVFASLSTELPMVIAGDDRLPDSGDIRVAGGLGGVGKCVSAVSSMEISGTVRPSASS